MSRRRDGSGNWNRAGRHSGGARPFLLVLGGPDVIGPFCAMGWHRACESAAEDAARRGEKPAGCSCDCHAKNGSP